MIIDRIFDDGREPTLASGVVQYKDWGGTEYRNPLGCGLGARVREMTWLSCGGDQTVVKDEWAL